MRAPLPLVMLLAVACVAEPSGVTPPIGDGGPTADGGNISGSGPFCDVVAQVFVPQCTLCHRPGGNPPDLTFSGAQTELVGASSPLFPGTTRVLAGDRAGSLLWRKVAGTLAPNEGGPMPVGSAGLPANLLEIVGAWIDAGAPTTCDMPTTLDGGPPGRYHPADYNRPEVHGLELKLQAQDCRSCHGNDLSGGIGASCDSCHTAGWRNDCTYCHGGTDSTSGAPPRELRGTIIRDMLLFRAHTEHTSERNHIAWDCEQCHTKPTDVLSLAHVFDDTPGTAELNFGGGLSPSGAYANGSCANLYCHGNGRTSMGSVDHTDARPGCDGCHPGANSTARWVTMSGEHRRHLREGITCGECHAATSNLAGTAIADGTTHVDGQVQLQFTAAGFARGAIGCTGTCHTERHTNERW